MRLFKLMIALLVVLIAARQALTQEEVVAQAYSTVNVRSGPGTEYDIIGQLNSGDQVPITGRSDDESNWLRIHFDSREGWVAYFTVTPLDDVSGLPIVQPLPLQTATPILLPSLTPTPLTTDIFVTAFRRVNVRSGPGMEYRRTGTLEPGTTADITGRSDDNQWLQVELDGEAGWVAYFVVSVTGTLDDVPVAEALTNAATQTPPAVEIVMRYNVNLREAPVHGAPILAVVPFGTTLQAEAVVEADSAGTWLRATYDGETGWLVRSLVAVEGILDDLPVIQSETLN